VRWGAGRFRCGAVAALCARGGEWELLCWLVGSDCNWQAAAHARIAYPEASPPNPVFGSPANATKRRIFSAATAKKGEEHQAYWKHFMAGNWYVVVLTTLRACVTTCCVQRLGCTGSRIGILLIVFPFHLVLSQFLPVYFCSPFSTLHSAASSSLVLFVATVSVF
jgi:hypothetical protein